MKQNLLNKFWLRVCMIVAVMTTALAGTAAAESVTLTAGTNGSTCTVNGKDGMKVGTSKAGGDMTITVPANTTKLTLHAAAWKGVTGLSINISGATASPASISLTADDGISNNSPFTLSGNEDDFVFEITLSNVTAETAVKFTSSIAKRFVIWDASAIVSSGGGGGTELEDNDLALTGAPINLEFDLYNNSQTQTISYTTSSTGEVSVETGLYDVSCYVDNDAKTISVTPFAVTNGSQTVTVKQAADDTYKAGSVTFTVTVTNSDPNASGTEANPYTVAEARAAIDAGSGVTEVYATGIVSAIPTAWSTSYNNITFNFVDATGDADFLQAFRCKSTDAADASNVAVGDVVVVKGNLTKYGSTYEFAQGCELVSLTKATVTVEAPIFSPEGGVYTTAQSVTIAVAAPTMDGYSFYYTTDGTEPTTSSTLYTAPIEISTTTTLKAIAVKDSELSTVTTATYFFCSATSPYTVTEALAFPEYPANGVYVHGVVSTAPTKEPTSSGQLTYYISVDGNATDQLQVYKGLGLDQAAFTAQDDIQVGDIVTVYGNVKIYNGTKEFDTGNYLVSFERPAGPTEPVIVAQDATIAYDVTYYELMYEIQNPVDGTELTATTTAAWITSLTPSTKSFDRVMIECEANDGTDARTATITLAYGNVTKEVTLTQEAYVAPVADYAELPFSFDGGKADIETTDGLTQEGLGTDYKNAPYLKFDGTDDYVLLKINERPGVLTFDIIGNGFSGGTFKVQASADGTTYTDVATYTELGAKETKTIADLAEDVRYIMWVYTEKSSGNVALGNINLAKYGTVVLNDYYLTIGNPANVTITASYGSDVLTNGEIEEVTEGTEVTLALTVADGYDLQSVTVAGEGEGQTVTLYPGTTEGVYTFTMPAFDVTVNATAVEHVDPVTAEYVLATSITSGKSYIIASGAAEGEVHVMAEQRTNNRGAVTATITNGVLNVSDEYEFVIETANIGEASGYSIFDPNAKGYLYAANSSKNYLMTQTDNDVNGVWTITIDATTGEASVVAEGSSNRNVMHYNANNGNPIFSCYAANSSITAPVYFLEKVGDTPTVQTVTVTAAGFATMVAEANLEIPTDVDVKVYAVKVANGYANLLPITDGIPAGEAVLVKASAGEYNFLHTTNPVSEVRENELIAATADVVADGTQFVLANGASGVGFYQANAGSTIPAGKAYLIYTGSSTVKGFTFAFEDDATGIESLNTQNTQNTQIYNLAGQRISKMQRGINIVGGKKILK